MKTQRVAGFSAGRDGETAESSELLGTSRGAASEREADRPSAECRWRFALTGTDEGVELEVNPSPRVVVKYLALSLAGQEGLQRLLVDALRFATILESDTDDDIDDS